MPEFISKPSLPTGLAGIAAQIQAQTAEILPRSIVDATKSIVGGLERRATQKFKAQQAEEERKFLEKKQKKEQNFLMALQNDKQAAEKDLAEFQQKQTQAVIDPKTLKQIGVIPKGAKFAPGRGGEASNADIDDKLIAQYRFLAPFKGQTIPITNLLRLSASIEASLARASQQADKQVIVEAGKLARESFDYLDAVTAGDEARQESLYAGFIRQAKKNLAKVKGKPVGKSGENSRKKAREALADIVADELLKK